MTTIQNTLTEADLAHFTGSEEYTRHGLMRNILISEGAKYVADKGGAHWLLDIIASMQLDKKVRAEEFQVWQLNTFKKDNSDSHYGILICGDGNGNEVYRQKIGYTDFPLPEIKLYFVNNVIHLPSEY